MSFWSRVWYAIRIDRLHREIDEELQGHLDDAVAAGRDLQEARHGLGPVLRIREASHHVRVAGWLEALFADIRFGWRQLGRNKVTSTAAVLSLALGMGSCVAAFRLIDALLWRPLPISGASRLYVVSRKMIGLNGKPAEEGHWSTPEFKRMRDAVKDEAYLIGVSDADRTDVTWANIEDMEKTHVAYASGNLFSTFGLAPSLGRVLTAADDRPSGSGLVAVLSWDYWNRRFGRDPQVLGRSVHVADQAFQIVGVGPRDFTGTEKGVVTDIFIPLSVSGYANDEGADWHRTFVLLKPGLDPATALEPLRQHLSNVNRGFQADCTTCFRGASPTAIERFLNQQLVIHHAGAGISDLQKDYRRYLGMLGLLAVLVLLIACVNVANITTAQAVVRAQEMALRISIGAGRFRLVQLMLAQSALLAALAGLFGALFAAWAAPFVLGLINPPGDPARLALAADWRVSLFGFALMVPVVGLLGLFPALRASAVRPVAVLKGGEDPQSSRRLMRGAIALQVTFCVLVLFLATLFVMSFRRLQNRPLGFSTDRVLLLETTAGKGKLPTVWNETAEALRSMPGVQSIAIARWPLLGHIAINSDISINGASPGPTPAFFLSVSPGWFATMKIPVLSGRDFRADDTSPGATVVNEMFARTFFPDRDPVGQTFQRDGQQSLYRIVGVSPDVPYRELREPNRPVFFVPFAETTDATTPKAVEFATFTIHTDAANPLSVADSLRQVIAERHNGLHVSNVTTQLELFRGQTVRERLIAMLASFFAVVALLLAGIGLYAVLNYSVLQRRREIGIRLAMGSSRPAVVRVVTSEVFGTVVLGSCAGVVLGLGAARYVESCFYQVKATDADVFALTASGIALTALLATLPATQRVLRADPTAILRTE